MSGIMISYWGFIFVQGDYNKRGTGRAIQDQQANGHSKRRGRHQKAARPRGSVRKINGAKTRKLSWDRW